MKKKKSKTQEASITRSSAVEYLTFVAASGEDEVEVVYADEDIWLTQRMMGVLYDVKTHTINYHLKKIFEDNELAEDSFIRKFRINAADGKNYQTGHYNLSAIIAVGYRVNSERAVQFRKWATGSTVHRSDRPRDSAGRRQSHRRDCQGPRRIGVREIPHRAGPLIGGRRLNGDAAIRERRPYRLLAS